MDGGSRPADEPALRQVMANRTGFSVFRTILGSILIGGFVGGYVMVRGRVHAVNPPHTVGETPVEQAPLCGLLDDGKVHIPPDWNSFTPPTTGDSYADPVFGCQVKRLTNSAVEETVWDGTHPSLMHYYSTFSPLNASDTMLLIASNTGSWRVKDTNGKVVIPSGKMPTMNNGHPVWDASDGGVFYYTLGKALHKATINGKSVKSAVLYTFKEYLAIVSPDAADLSQDGDHIALIGQNADNTLDVFVWSLSTQTKTSVYTTACKISGNAAETSQAGCVHKLQLTPNNFLAIQFAEDGSDAEQGLRLWNGNKLMHLQDRTNHFDTGYDLNGNPVFIAIGNRAVLSGQTNPCPSEWGLDIRQLNHTSSAACLLDRQPSLHVSYRGSSAQPWIAISFFDDRKAGPELFNNSPGFQVPSPGNWQIYEDEIILARVDGAAIYHLAHARSRSAVSYWAQPHAAISRDGKYVVFSSNMAYPNGCPAKMHTANECTDVYLIKVR